MILVDTTGSLRYSFLMNVRIAALVYFAIVIIISYFMVLTPYEC